jgi:hypothetical protein
MRNKRVIVDANIAFKCLLTGRGDLRTRIGPSPLARFYTPRFLFVEMFKHKERLARAAHLSESDLLEALYTLVSRMEFVNEANIPLGTWLEAFRVCRDVDEKDTPLRGPYPSHGWPIVDGGRGVESRITDQGVRSILPVTGTPKRRSSKTVQSCCLSGLLLTHSKKAGSLGKGNTRLFKRVPDHNTHFWRRGKLIAEKVLRGDRDDIPLQFGNGADPGSLGKFPGGSFDELSMRKGHVPRVVKDFAILDHNQDRVTVSHFDFFAHSRLVVDKSHRILSLPGVRVNLPVPRRMNQENHQMVSVAHKTGIVVRCGTTKAI